MKMESIQLYQMLAMMRATCINGCWLSRTKAVVHLLLFDDRCKLIIGGNIIDVDIFLLLMWNGGGGGVVYVEANQIYREHKLNILCSDKFSKTICIGAA